LFGDGQLGFRGQLCRFGRKDQQLYDEYLIPTSCGQWEYQAERPILYRNLGGGRFADVSQASSVRQSAERRLYVAFTQNEQGSTDIPGRQ